MDAAVVAGGGPAPFLIKTYDMVDDSATDEIVSWSSTLNSFVVWNPPEFARLLLPTYFKHNNFSSFIRQLNTYDISFTRCEILRKSAYFLEMGFRKIDSEKWEFANEEFLKDQKHLLKNIHRRKPVHSHSHPQNSGVDSERAAFDDEIERLSREKHALEADVLRFRQQHSAAKLQLEDLTQKVAGIELRQDYLATFVEKNFQNQTFISHLVEKIEAMDFSAYNKKRRLPQVDHAIVVVDDRSVDEISSHKPDLGNVIQEDFSNKLNLELSPAVSDINLISGSTQSSNEDGGSPWKKAPEGEDKDAQRRPGSFLFAPETLELSDTGNSLKFKIGSPLSLKAGMSEGTKLWPLQKNLCPTEENDDQISCQLNLTLASSPFLVNGNHSSASTASVGQEIGKSSESKCDSGSKEAELIEFPKKRDSCETISSSSQDTQEIEAKPPVAQARVNDVFWEQFLTERPGSSDTEETCCKFRVNPYSPENKSSGNGIFRNTENMEQLTL